MSWKIAASGKVSTSSNHPSGPADGWLPGHYNTYIYMKQTTELETKIITELTRRNIRVVSCESITPIKQSDLRTATSPDPESLSESAPQTLIDLALPGTYEPASSLYLESADGTISPIIFGQAHEILEAQYRPLVEELFGPNISLYFVLDVDKQLHLKVFQKT